jgi:hypothetical protein
VRQVWGSLRAAMAPPRFVGADGKLSTAAFGPSTPANREGQSRRIVIRTKIFSTTTILDWREGNFKLRFAEEDP